MRNMHPDQRALLDNILANPDDDVARLVYADWLQENGQEARAEFIQSQIAMSGKRCSGENRSANRKGTGRRCRCQWCQNYRKGQLLLQEHCSEWFRYNKEPSIYATNTTRIDGRWNRGFVDHVICTFYTWVIFAEEILAEHPVREVHISTEIAGYAREHPDKEGWMQYVWEDDDDEDAYVTDISPDDRENPVRDDPYQPTETWPETACRVRWPGPESQPIQYYRA